MMPPTRHPGTGSLVRGLAVWGVLGLFVGTPHAQDEEQFRGRLSVLPVDFATAPTMSGSGEAHATFADGTLVVTGRFEGLSSRATVAHLHRAPPARRGPVAFTLEVTSDVSGAVGGTFELNASETRTLRESGYYVQIHTETNDDGEIRGWLMPSRP
jgi:hypothetical protein